MFWYIFIPVAIVAAIAVILAVACCMVSSMISQNEERLHIKPVERNYPK